MRPLDGIRVVDLTVVWSGPGGTALLGDLGAEVIRVEGNNRVSRQASATMTKELILSGAYHGATFPDRDPGKRPYDRSALFNWHSRNKLACCMNLETPEGHEAVLKLLEISDVFVENNASGTLEKLGLCHAELRKRFPRLIIARMPPLGLSGSMSDYLGYGPNFNSLVGIAAMDGYEGETPDTAGENYHMDEAAPAGLAFAVLAALLDRDRTGDGGLIEFAQAENVMQDIGEHFLARQLTGRNPPILGNADPHLLQDVYPAAGDDRWVAISLRHDRDQAALADLTGEPLGSEPAAVKERIAAWTRDRDPDDIVSALQAAGIPAGEVMTETQVLGDPHLKERGWFRRRSHPSVGSHTYPGQPWKADSFTPAFGRVTPAFGEDNAYVYQTLLGYSDDAYDDLVRRGLVTNQQFA